MNNSTDMKNWRPVSLFNYDYKIISKSIASRLGTVMETLVHENQTLAVKGRSIFDNVHLYRDVIDCVDNKKTKRSKNTREKTKCKQIP